MLKSNCDYNRFYDKINMSFERMFHMKKLIFLLSILLVLILSSCSSYDDIELLYSNTFFTSEDFSPDQVVTSFSQYTDTNYPIELDAEFFNDYVLYTYSFMNNETGKDLFKLTDDDIIDNTLTLTLEETKNEGEAAFATYIFIFAIKKDIYNEVDAIEIVFD